MLLKLDTAPIAGLRAKDYSIDQLINVPSYLMEFQSLADATAAAAELEISRDRHERNHLRNHAHTKT